MPSWRQISKIAANISLASACAYLTCWLLATGHAPTIAFLWPACWLSVLIWLGILWIWWRAALSLFAGLLSGLLIWSFLNIGVMAREADEAAAGRPYCLQIRNIDCKNSICRPAYRAIASRIELQGLAIWSLPTDVFPHWTFYAVLVIDPGSERKDLRNWSFRLRSFSQIRDSTRENLREYPLEPHCEPRPDFMRHLTFF